MKCLHVDHAVKRDILKSLLKITVEDQNFLWQEDTCIFISKGGTIMQCG